MRIRLPNSAARLRLAACRCSALASLLAFGAGATTTAPQGDLHPQALALMPTAYFPDAGTRWFKEYEVFVLSGGYVLRSGTSISGGLVPLPWTGVGSPSFPLAFIPYVGLKQRVFESAEGGFASAIWGGNTWFSASGYDDNEMFIHSAIWNVDAILSSRLSPAFILHSIFGTMGGTGYVPGVYGLNGALGAAYSLSARATLMGEWLTARPFRVVGRGRTIDDKSNMGNLTLRLQVERAHVDLGVIVLVSNSKGAFPFPLVSWGGAF